MHIFKGRVKRKERKECDGGHLDSNCLIFRCWIRGRNTAYFLIQYPWFKQEYTLQIKVYITTFRYMRRMYYICRQYNYCTKNIDNIVISQRGKYVKIGL